LLLEGVLHLPDLLLLEGVLHFQVFFKIFFGNITQISTFVARILIKER
jgi:hypothetical protein